MATSSRQSQLFGINDWQAIYKTFSQADFKSYDYETLRKSFIDYLRINYPETFTDYTESSEFIALLDVIAFMGQGLAFRNDLNTRENFIDTAERRDSVIKLANLVSYTPKRNISASGYIKVTSIRTSENLTDLNGFSLGNSTILWNDPANSNWLQQFNTIINAALVNSQRVGKPGNSKTILSIKTDEYSIQIPTSTLPISTFSATVDGINMVFELVSATSVGQDYIYELPPNPSGQFNILYRNDKLGYGSTDTGFFFYFKQGELQTYDFSLEQQISNQTVDIGSIENINNSDTWLYQFNTTTNARTLWTQVDSVYSSTNQNSNNSLRKIYSVISRSNDQVSYSFGDGVFSEIPLGNFRAYIRSSNALTYSIEPSEFQGVNATFSYVSRSGKTETLTFGLQLQRTVTNAQTRENLASIKQRAPSRYYTQNRMVNGEDYNNFPYTLYSSIIKSKAINRSSVGIARNLDLLDPTQKYSSTNSFADDGALYQDSSDGYVNVTINNLNNIITFLTNTLTTILNSNGAKQYYTQNYSRYVPTKTTYWQTSTTDSTSVTGYFYELIGLFKNPQAIGPYSSSNLKYISKGSSVQITAPSGYYFDDNNRLTTDSTYPSSKWVYTVGVIGDGFNYGQGTFNNGTGPVTMNGYIPSGVTVTGIIPVFGNTLSSSIIQQCVAKMNASQNFSLVFNNTLLSNQERWSIGDYSAANYFVNFKSTSSTSYIITYKSLKYYFGSVADIRFYFEDDKIVYDPVSGKTLNDYVKILASNSQPTSKSPLYQNYSLNIVAQQIESDGYVDDFEVEVASLDQNDSTIITNPDFFKEITNYDSSLTVNNKYFVFFQRIQDTSNTTRYQILKTSTVIYIYADKNQIEVVKYDYPVGQLFYAYSTGIFYITVQNAAVKTLSYTVTAQTAGNYIAKTGRQGLGFQYRHNSNNTSRIDPATTNIIDLYVVTQSYYTQYVNWIQDTTNTVTKPSVPTINDLNTAYSSGIDNYKMISDSVIFNSVVFKPLFGSKAETALQATVKIVKTTNTSASNSEIRSAVLTAMNNYFSINNWNFGDTFYFSELSAYLHTELGDYINSVVLVPNDPTLPFGTLYEIKSAPNEIFVNGITSTDITIISALTPSELQMT